VDVSGVPQQVLDQPRLARRYGCVQAGPFGCVRQLAAFAAQRGYVLVDLHAAILPG
jgi:hypothetical protein